MLKKFVEGLVFGGGFALSFIALWYLAAYLVTPIFVSSQFERATTSHSPATDSTPPTSITRRTEIPSEQETPFHELPLEEQIKQSSVIALAKYERAHDGKMKAILTEFLKKEPNVSIFYNIGDEHPSSSYYPKDNTRYGDGVVMFFTGKPASMRMSMSYSGGRLHSLGDMPVELFRKKCNDINA